MNIAEKKPTDENTPTSLGIAGHNVYTRRSGGSGHGRDNLAQCVNLHAFFDNHGAG